MSPDRVVQVLLERPGRTFAEELGIDLTAKTPEVLFRWLLRAALLLSARIPRNERSARRPGIADRVWTTAQDMAAAKLGGAHARA